MEKIASTLGLSESLAGVTLLALGNGSPDVISSLSAASSESGGMFLAVGSLVGAGLFVSGVVSAVVMLSAPQPIHVLGKGLLRDTIFYIISLGVLVSAAFVGELSVYFGIAFLGIYVLFVITVVLMEQYEERKKLHRQQFRQTLMVKRDSVGGLNNQEQRILNDADLDEDAYYFKDGEDHLVEIKIEKEDEVEEGDFDSRFERMMDTHEEENDDEDNGTGDVYDEYKESVVPDRNSLKQKENLSDNLYTHAINSSINGEDEARKTEKELRYSSLPEVQVMKTQIGSPKGSGASSSKLDASLTDLIETTKIEPSKDLSSFLVDDHYEEPEELLGHHRAADIKRMNNMSRLAKKTKHKIVWSMLKMRKFLRKGIEGEESFSEMSLFNKIIFILVDVPFDFMRRLTIPPSDHESWNRRNAAVVPIMSVLFTFVVTGYIDFTSSPPYMFYIAEGIALVLSLMICFLTPLNNGPRRTMIFFSVFAFLFSILWIWFIANILIHLLGLLGLIFQLKQAYLGITVLAWGNSVGDMMANSAVAKKGFARMALVGCFAGPLFNLLIGLGLSLIIKEINGQAAEVFEIDDTDALLPMITIGALILQLLMVIGIAVSTKFFLDKVQGYVHIVYFVIVILTVTVAAFTFAS